MPTQTWILCSNLTSLQIGDIHLLKETGRDFFSSSSFWRQVTITHKVNLCANSDRDLVFKLHVLTNRWQ